MLWVQRIWNKRHYVSETEKWKTKSCWIGEGERERERDIWMRGWVKVRQERMDGRHKFVPFRWITSDFLLFLLHLNYLRNGCQSLHSSFLLLLIDSFLSSSHWLTPFFPPLTDWLLVSCNGELWLMMSFLMWEENGGTFWDLSEWKEEGGEEHQRKNRRYLKGFYFDGSCLLPIVTFLPFPLQSRLLQVPTQNFLNLRNFPSGSSLFQFLTERGSFSLLVLNTSESQKVVALSFWMLTNFSSKRHGDL